MRKPPSFRGGIHIDEHNYLVAWTLQDKKSLLLLCILAVLINNDSPQKGKTQYAYTEPQTITS